LRRLGSNQRHLRGTQAKLGWKYIRARRWNPPPATTEHRRIFDNVARREPGESHAEILAIAIVVDPELVPRHGLHETSVDPVMNENRIGRIRRVRAKDERRRIARHDLMVERHWRVGRAVPERETVVREFQGTKFRGLGFTSVLGRLRAEGYSPSGAFLPVLFASAAFLPATCFAVAAFS
jgi:hypothetical protein